MNIKTRYKNYMIRNRKTIKSNISRLHELNNIFCWSDDEYNEYNLIIKTLCFDCRMFNIQFNKHIKLKRFLELFGY